MSNLRTLRTRQVEGLVRRTVIVVDREALYRWFVTETLDPHGLHVVQAGTMAEATRYLDLHRPADLLLVDSQSVADEGASAIDALQRRARSLPCVLLGAEEMIGASIAIEGTRAVPKPLDSATLLTLVGVGVVNSAAS